MFNEPHFNTPCRDDHYESLLSELGINKSTVRNYQQFPHKNNNYVFEEVTS